MDRLSIASTIRNQEKLLSLPQVLSEVLQEVSKEDIAADKLAKIILKDPSLTGQVLKMANSPFYHRLSEIKTVQQAVSIMGVTTVKCLALSATVLRPERIQAVSGVDPKLFFSHVLSVAAASETLASAVGFRPVEEAFIAGLLHDIGILFFLHHYPQQYGTIISSRKQMQSLAEAEAGLFGMDHCEVGRQLGELWHLPSHMVDAIASHHEVGEALDGETLQQIVALATFVSGDHFSGYELGMQQRLQSISQLAGKLNLTKEQIDVISSSLLSRTVGVAQYLGVDIGDFEEMLMRANQEIWRSYLTVENLYEEREQLTANLLKQERERGAAEAKAVAMATLSHYLNNATMAIYGRSQLLRMMLQRQQVDKLIDKLPRDLEIVDQSIAKIVAVLEEMREISPVDRKELYSMSRGLNIDDRLEKRLARMREESSWTAAVEMHPSKK